MNLTLTSARLRLEREAERLVRAWLVARVAELAGGDLVKAWGEPDLIKAEQLAFFGDITPHEAEQLTFFGEHGPREAWTPETIFDPKGRYGKRIPAIKAGEELFYQIQAKARDLGAKEAARALLLDPPREYRDATEKRLRGLARKQVELVDATTRRLMRKITSEGRPDNVQELLHKIYSASRCEGIATDQVSKGYVQGVAEVLRQHGYRYVYVQTMGDDQVCSRCAPWLNKPMTIMQFLKLYPRHPRCRCWPSSSRDDGTRDEDLHRKGMMTDWTKAVRARSRR